MEKALWCAWQGRCSLSVPLDSSLDLAVWIHFLMVPLDGGLVCALCTVGGHLGRGGL
jgi:hypothetical protein